jgi:putative ABC transport system permease protein
MLSNNFKIVFRQAGKSPLYTGINLFGLSAGIASCIIISLFVSNEFKYDEFNNGHERIFRVTTTETEEGVTRHFANTYMPILPLLQSQMAEIEDAVRLIPQSVSIANKEKNLLVQEDKFVYADSNFFNVFSFRLLKGDVHTALKDPHNLLLTQEAAAKYFGTADPLGKELLVEQNTVFKVAGIFEDIPAQSSLQFDVLVPMTAAKDIFGDFIFNAENTWYFPETYGYVKFKSTSGIVNANQMLSSFEKKFMPDYVSDSRSHRFQKLTDIHFSNLENELQPTINKNILYVFAVVGVVMLLIAAFNFINLFLSRIVFRFRSVGIQKVMGAGNRHIWWQTLTESLFFLFAAFFLATLWIILFLPSFNNLMHRELVLFAPETTGVWILLFALLAATGLLISVFPSLMLTRFKLVNVLKGKNESLFPRKKLISLQSSFVVSQFVIAVVLIMATIIMQSQMNYIRNKDLGMQKEQILVLPVRDEGTQDNFSLVKNKLSQVNGVSQVSAISNFPWQKGFYDFETTIRKEGKTVRSNAPTLLVAEDFVETMGMTMIKGRDFSKDFRTDSSSAFIINESAAAKFGITNPEGVKLLMQSVAAGKPKEGELIGIVKDFHLQSLHEAVQPLILTVSPQSYYIDNIVLKVSANDVPSTLKNIELTLKEISPSRPFEYFFLDGEFDNLYQRETRLSTLFNYFSIMAIIIACLGLLGIAAFGAAQRVKEIGIRKVLGASTKGIVFLLTKDFITLVLVAVVIASPVAWYLMNQWLADFAYRIDMQWWMFVAAGVMAVAIAFLTIGFQSIKAALANPVKSLKSE